MQINLSWDSSVSSAPAGFEAAVEQGAAILDQAIINPITVTIQVGWGEVAGTAIASGANGGPEGAGVAGQASQDIISTAEAKALGISTAWVSTSYPQGVDGVIGFGAGEVPGTLYFQDAVIHELTHALGRVQGCSPMSDYTYSAPGVLWNQSSTTPGYFSLDKGVTDIVNFSSIDPADFEPPVPGVMADPFSIEDFPGGQLTALDCAVLQTLGFTLAPGTPTLPGAQRVVFPDFSIALDMLPTQSGGMTAEMLGAVGGPSALTNQAWAGDGIRAFDAGASMQQVAQGVINAGILPTSNSGFVTQLWQNVVGTPIDPTHLATYTTDLTNGIYTQASLLALAAGTTTNQTTINLAGMAMHGLQFV